MDGNSNEVIKYKIVFSRRRSIGISVGPDTGVTVRAPHRTSLKSIDSLVLSKSAWIRKHLENYKSTVRINSQTEFTDATEILFRGKKLKLRFVESKKNSITLRDDILEICWNDIRIKDKTGALIDAWYKKISEPIFRKKFEEILIKYSHYQFNPAEFKVRSLKRRWGSCSSKGTITISSELVKLDEIYLEYVILHELCHLKHHNHGAGFYKLLAEVFPGWKQRRSELMKFIR